MAWSSSSSTNFNPTKNAKGSLVSKNDWNFMGLVMMVLKAVKLEGIANNYKLQVIGIRFKLLVSSFTQTNKGYKECNVYQMVLMKYAINLSFQLIKLVSNNLC